MAQILIFMNIIAIFMLKRNVHNVKNVYKPMRRVFTLLFLLIAFTVITPTAVVANSTYELSAIDARFGEKDYIKLYPNPMVSDATIKISDEIDVDKSKVSITFYNIVGSEVFKVNQVKDYELKIFKDNFKNSGIYFYQLKIDEKVITTGRITVK